MNTNSGVNGTQTATTASNTAAVTVTAQSLPPTPAITITTQPAASTYVIIGSIIGSLNVTATVTSGGTPAYQWYSSTTGNNTGGTAIPGATSASFPIPTGLTSGTYYYYVTVRATGAASVTSDIAEVTVSTMTVINGNNSDELNARLSFDGNSGVESVSVSGILRITFPIPMDTTITGMVTIYPQMTLTGGYWVNDTVYAVPYRNLNYGSYHLLLIDGFVDSMHDCLWQQMLSFTTVQYGTGPAVRRSVSLPMETGISSYPMPGTHYVFSGGDFTFTMTFPADKSFTVTADRLISGQSETLAGTRNADGSYTFWYKRLGRC